MHDIARWKPRAKKKKTEDLEQREAFALEGKMQFLWLS